MSEGKEILVPNRIERTAIPANIRERWQYVAYLEFIFADLDDPFNPTGKQEIQDFLVSHGDALRAKGISIEERKESGNLIITVKTQSSEPETGEAVRVLSATLQQRFLCTLHDAYIRENISAIWGETFSIQVSQLDETKPSVSRRIIYQQQFSVRGKIRENLRRADSMRDLLTRETIPELGESRQKRLLEELETHIGIQTEILRQLEEGMPGRLAEDTICLAMTPGALHVGTLGTMVEAGHAAKIQQESETLEALNAPCSNLVEALEHPVMRGAIEEVGAGLPPPFYPKVSQILRNEKRTAQLLHAIKRNLRKILEKALREGNQDEIEKKIEDLLERIVTVTVNTRSTIIRERDEYLSEGIKTQSIVLMSLIHCGFEHPQELLEIVDFFVNREAAKTAGIGIKDVIAAYPIQKKPFRGMIVFGRRISNYRNSIDDIWEIDLEASGKAYIHFNEDGNYRRACFNGYEVIKITDIQHETFDFAVVTEKECTLMHKRTLGERKIVPNFFIPPTNNTLYFQEEEDGVWVDELGKKKKEIFSWHDIGKQVLISLPERRELEIPEERRIQKVRIIENAVIVTVEDPFQDDQQQDSKEIPVMHILLQKDLTPIETPKNEFLKLPNNNDVDGNFVALERFGSRFLSVCLAKDKNIFTRPSSKLQYIIDIRTLQMVTIVEGPARQDQKNVEPVKIFYVHSFEPFREIAGKRFLIAVSQNAQKFLTDVESYDMETGKFQACSVEDHPPPFLQYPWDEKFEFLRFAGRNFVGGSVILERNIRFPVVVDGASYNPENCTFNLVMLKDRKGLPRVSGIIGLTKIYGEKKRCKVFYDDGGRRKSFKATEDDYDKENFCFRIPQRRWLRRGRRRQEIP